MRNNHCQPAYPRKPRIDKRPTAAKLTPMSAMRDVRRVFQACKTSVLPSAENSQNQANRIGS